MDNIKASIEGDSVRMPPFPAFVERFGSPIKESPLTIDIQASLPSNFPVPLIEHWRIYGFGSYADGLIWTHPPSQFEAVIEDWTGISRNDAILITRHSFGDFTMWARGHLYFVNVQLGEINKLPEEVDFIFDVMLCDYEFLGKFLRKSLHQECTLKLGKCSAMECFGFVPALALGGTETVESVQKVRMSEYLAILSQINELQPSR